MARTPLWLGDATVGLVHVAQSLLCLDGIDDGDVMLGEKPRELWRELIKGASLYLEDTLLVFHIGDTAGNLDLVVGRIPIDAILEYSVKHLLGERTYSAGSVIGLGEH